MTLPLAITMGDVAGIGPEIIAKAFRDAPEALRGCFVAGDVATLRRAAAIVQGAGVPLPVALIERPADALAVPATSPMVMARGRVMGEDEEGAGRGGTSKIF